MKKEKGKTLKIYEAFFFGMVILVIEFILLTLFIIPML